MTIVNYRNVALLIAFISLCADSPAHGAATLKGKIWPVENRPIPYILPTSQFGAPTLKAIREAIDALRAAGVQMQKIEPSQKPKDKGWILFASPPQPRTCVAPAGFQGKSEHIITIGSQCRNLCQQRTERGEVLHEILHALGFIHEHQRTDGGDFVIMGRMEIALTDRFVNTGLEAGKAVDAYFPDRIKKEVEYHGGYDLFSVMHYPLDGQFLSPRDEKLPGRFTVGLRNELSDTDKKAIRKLYGN
jgi:hypothetical protein